MFAVDESNTKSPWPILSIGHDLRSLTEDRLDLARSWLETCINTHQDCPTAVHKLPKRVLTLNPDSIGIKLKETVNESGRYAALSYCWGQTRNITTTRDNIASMLTGIPLEVLPQTIKEAVQVTKHLGIDNLWVDSLCIIQDSQEDWIQQAALMCDIYTNATLVLAVHSGSDANSGCLHTDDSRNTQIATFTTSIDGATDVKVSIRNSSWSGEASPTHRIKRGISFLNRRGWTFQEYVLGRRMLHCTSHELGWQCQKTYSCECRPLFPLVPALAEFKKLVLGQSIIAGEKLSDDVRHHPQLHTIWRDLVYEYAKRSFTVGTDNLPALSGFVTALSRRYPQCFGREEYMFGIWRGDLVRYLLWTSGSLQGPSRRLPHENAPSWSWTSCGNSGIGYKESRWARVGLHIVELVKVVDVSCTPSTTNPFGPGKGRISLHGTLQPVRLHWTAPKQLSEFSSALSRSGKSIDYISLELDDGSGAEIEEDCQHYFLALATWTLSYDIHGVSYDIWHGILIVPVPGAVDIFRRVAYGHTKGLRTGEDLSTWELPLNTERTFDLV
jgi:Heterokaryon incompatibility protein (HET)